MAPLTLTIDIGGSHIKAAVIDATGTLIEPRVRIETPVGAPPLHAVATIASMVRPLPAFDRVSVGFPGVVRGSRVLTAHNLGNELWLGFDLGGSLAAALERPVRVANDADLQGLAVIAGRGVEMVITLGTGFGTGLYLDGRVGPHLELAHHPFRKRQTYEQQLGNAARKEVGAKRWNRRLGKAIATLRRLTLFDHLYIGGGNVRHVELDLDPDVSLVSNIAGLTGGPALWRD